jgi:A/G-specific adenine glycosylase
MRFRDARGRAKPGEFLQAMMELGQIICLPRQPHCTECPIALQCKSFQGGIQNSMPAPQRRSRIPHFNVTAGVIERRGRVLIARRPAGTILAGMWEFPGGKRERGETLPASLRRELREELGIGIRTQEKIYSLDHAFTHMRITLHVYRCILARGNPHPIGVDAVRWVKTKDLAKYPMGKADRRVVDFLFPIGRVKKNING